LTISSLEGPNWEGVTQVKIPAPQLFPAEFISLAQFSTNPPKFFLAYIELNFQTFLVNKRETLQQMKMIGTYYKSWFPQL
jgi:hypothetical protein